MIFAEAAPTDVPAWLQLVMDFLVAVPVIGPTLLIVLKWLGVIAAFTTALSTGLTVIAKSLQVTGKALGFVKFAENIQSIYAVVWPYLAWLSVYNAKKK